MQLKETADEQSTEMKYIPYVRCSEGKIKAGKKNGGVGRCAVLNWMLREKVMFEC